MNKTMTNLANAIAGRRTYSDSLYTVSPNTLTGAIEVRYRTTVVAKIRDNRVTLHNGGYFTATTKKVINAVLDGLGSGWQVVQDKGEWLVQYRADKKSRMPWRDGFLFQLEGPQGPAPALSYSGNAPALGAELAR